MRAAVLPEARDSELSRGGHCCQYCTVTKATPCLCVRCCQGRERSFWCVSVFFFSCLSTSLIGFAFVFLLFFTFGFTKRGWERERREKTLRSVILSPFFLFLSKPFIISLRYPNLLLWYIAWPFFVIAAALFTDNNLFFDHTTRSLLHNTRLFTWPHWQHCACVSFHNLEQITCLLCPWCRWCIDFVVVVVK